MWSHSSKEKVSSKIYTQKKITKREKLLGIVKPFVDESCDSAEPYVIAYYLNNPINLGALKSAYEKVGSQVLYKEPYLYVESCAYFNQQNSSAVFFKNGCIVIWSMNKQNRNKFFHFCKKYITLNENNIENYDFEELQVENINNKSYVNNSVIYLTSNNYRTTDKIAISFGLLSAVRLNNLEKKIEKKLFYENDHIENSKKKNQVKYELNIDQDILDVPEALWELEYQRKLFLNILHIFDIKQRVDLLNHRLSWTLDYLNSFLDYVNQKHSSRLERIIIVIIGLELVLGIMQMVNTIRL
ncbi:hypothetical protein PCYB_062690 [Plasmodium cynomolgi strain B]|uniref:DUF155 domain-containing protein n=1 Tax=Plasmodium cynomolgi (strain B) TaxID=1120755 RepID=K6V8T5_PLACD|nr:hypothetical protein PCYB_062690 [Plasmodium cynomolgi strain B]GAB65537.1 hypothetical protein PCYB_062690 [Plasmodium cynomolgi strain B]